MPRKEKKFHFIYKTTNILSGKYYVGMHSTDNIDDGYLGSGKRLRYSINKYGKDNHSREILEFLDSRQELKDREKEIVNLDEIAKIECMNLSIGGEGGFSLENATKGGYALANKLITDSKFREHHSKLASKNMRSRLIEKWKNTKFREAVLKNLDWNGRNHSIETKRKIGEANSKKQLGSSNSQFGTCWICKGSENKKIKNYDLDSFLVNGWIKGRKI
jgi:hypothetical protein